MDAIQADAKYGLRPGAEEFPLMVVISIIYPCNFGCPMCPYTDSNSELRKFYHEHEGDLLPVPLWQKMADECGEYGAWMRCTGGGEPFLHPQMVEMVEYAKARAARGRPVTRSARRWTAGTARASAALWKTSRTAAFRQIQRRGVNNRRAGAKWSAR